MDITLSKEIGNTVELVSMVHHGLSCILHLIRIQNKINLKSKEASKTAEVLGFTTDPIRSHQKCWSSNIHCRALTNLPHCAPPPILPFVNT